MRAGERPKSGPLDYMRVKPGDLSLKRYHAVVTCCDQTTFAPFRFVLNSNFVARGSLCGCHADGKSTN